MKNWLIGAFCFIFQAFASAHPHSFLTMQNKVLIADGHLTGFAMRWTLDEITSAELIYEIQTASDKAAALAKITEELNISAIESHYFSELYDQDQQAVKFKAKPVKPKSSVENNRLVYEFELQLAKPQAVQGKTFKFFTFEPSYYLYMGYDQPSDVSIGEQNLCKVSLVEPDVNQSLRLYASKLDKSENPDMPSDRRLSLGAQFAQMVRVQCQ